MPGNFEEEFASQFSIGDPDPVPEGSTSEEKLKYAEAVSSYAKDMLYAFQSSTLTGEDLWLDFTSTFRKHTIPHIPNRLLKDWVDVLTQGNVYVKRQKRISESTSIAGVSSTGEVYPEIFE